jgi:hypothetical protein
MGEREISQNPLKERERERENICYVYIYRMIKLSIS